MSETPGWAIPGLTQAEKDDFMAALTESREGKPMSDLRKDITTAINRNSAENGSDTPDYILARFLEASLAAFDLAVRDRDEWHGFKA